MSVQEFIDHLRSLPCEEKEYGSKYLINVSVFDFAEQLTTKLTEQSKVYVCESIVTGGWMSPQRVSEWITRYKTGMEYAKWIVLYPSAGNILHVGVLWIEAALTLFFDPDEDISKDWKSL